MSNDIKLVGFRAKMDFYHEIKSYAEEHGVNISDLLRESIKQYLTGDKPTNTEEFKIVFQQLDKKDEQLKIKDEQINHLHQLLAMKERNVDSLNRQLEQKELMLEDMRNRSVWKRIKTAFGFGLRAKQEQA